jgi:4-carboxymuconolactone decarboxylase
MQGENRSPRRVVGQRIREEVLGEAHTRATAETAHPFDALFCEFTEDFCWGNIWSRPGLSRSTRSMLNLAMLAVLGHWHEFEVHTRGALNNGVSEEEIGEILLQTGVYAGIPVAAESLRRAKAILLERARSRDGNVQS